VEAWLLELEFEKVGSYYIVYKARFLFAASQILCTTSNGTSPE
jgi:hypothetical protein